MTDNNDQSSDTQSDQNNSCSNERIEGPTFIDDDGCPGSCPALEDQSDDIPEGCPVPTQTTTTDSQETNSDEDAIKVMTVHASKGMEFPVVFIIDTIGRKKIFWWNKRYPNSFCRWPKQNGW